MLSVVILSAYMWLGSMLSVEHFRFVECYHALCRYTECRGSKTLDYALGSTFILTSLIKPTSFPVEWYTKKGISYNNFDRLLIFAPTKHYLP
jgi:hypothetical protein